jgi:hypothetical protein
MENFSTNASALHVSNLEYDASEYIRDFKQFELLQ